MWAQPNRALESRVLGPCLRGFARARRNPALRARSRWNRKRLCATGLHGGWLYWYCSCTRRSERDFESQRKLNIFAKEPQRETLVIWQSFILGLQRQFLEFKERRPSILAVFFALVEATKEARCRRVLLQRLWESTAEPMHTDPIFHPSQLACSTCNAARAYQRLKASFTSASFRTEHRKSSTPSKEILCSALQKIFSRHKSKPTLTFYGVIGPRPR